MTTWLYDERDLTSTPSMKDGISYEEEAKFRREGARLIIDVGADLNLRYDTVATGCVYFHRFFLHHSFKEFNRYVTAIGCLFLAGKVEETPKKCRDLLRVAKPRLSEQQFLAFGDDPREEVMTVERVLLQTINFDLQVNHPYQFVIKYAKILQGNKTDIEKMVQMAWTFINDSLCTTICLQWESEIVAIALMYLASRLGKCTIEDWKNRKNVPGEKWWDQFVEDLDLKNIEEICHQVLDLYSNNAAIGAGQRLPIVPSRPSNAPTISLAPTTATSSIAASTPSSAVSSQAPTFVNGNASGGITTTPLIRRDSTKLPASAIQSVQSSSALSSASLATDINRSTSWQRSSLDSSLMTSSAVLTSTTDSISRTTAQPVGSVDYYYYADTPTVRHAQSNVYGNDAVNIYSNSAAGYSNPTAGYSNATPVNYGNSASYSNPSTPVSATELNRARTGYRNPQQQSIPVRLESQTQQHQPYGRTYPTMYD